MELHPFSIVVKKRTTLSVSSGQSGVELLANCHKSESELVFNCIKALAGMAYQQVYFSFIKLHMLILLTGREWSEKYQIPRTVAHKKPKEGDQRAEAILKKKREKIHLRKEEQGSGGMAQKRRAGRKAVNKQIEGTVQEEQDWHQNVPQVLWVPDCEGQSKEQLHFSPHSAAAI